MNLSRLSLPALKTLLGLIESGRLKAPFSRASLAAVGFGRWQSELQPLSSLHPSAVSEVLQAIIIEREQRPATRVELVWTGPSARSSEARDTAVIVENLLTSAQTSVVIAGYRFDRPQILEPLHRAMLQRNVTASVFLDIPGEARNVCDADAVATAEIGRFFDQVWQFGPPLPVLYYEPRTAMGWMTCLSLHAKCIVVDEERALVTSANFTDRGQTRNIEVGALIHDAEFATALAGQWFGVVQAGFLKKWAPDFSLR